MVELELSQGCAVVTGAASGIGRALALQLAEMGMSVAMADINEAGLRAVQEDVERLGAKSIIAVVDSSNFETVERFAQEVFDWTEVPVKLVLANAGIHGLASAIDPDLALFEKVAAVNLMGPVHMAKAFVPRLMKQDLPAQFVITGSQASYLAAPGMAPYVATKHANWGYADSLRIELLMAGSPVGVSLVAPSRTDSGLTAPQFEKLRESQGEEAAQAYKAQMIGPDAIAHVVLREVKKRPFWIIPSHESTLDVFKARAQAIIDAMPAGEIETASS